MFVGSPQAMINHDEALLSMRVEVDSLVSRLHCHFRLLPVWFEIEFVPTARPERWCANERAAAARCCRRIVPFRWQFHRALRRSILRQWQCWCRLNQKELDSVKASIGGGCKLVSNGSALVYPSSPQAMVPIVSAEDSEVIEYWNDQTTIEHHCNQSINW